jgi:hypothetical protein
MQDATMVIGMLVGFLVVGVIGVYIGSEIVSAVNISENDSLYTSQTTIIETFELGVSLCKIIIIVSVAGLVFMLLQQLGLIPRIGGGGGGA